MTSAYCFDLWSLGSWVESSGLNFLFPLMLGRAELDLMEIYFMIFVNSSSVIYPSWLGSRPMMKSSTDNATEISLNIKALTFVLAPAHHFCNLFQVWSSDFPRAISIKELKDLSYDVVRREFTNVACPLVTHPHVGQLISTVIIWNFHFLSIRILVRAVSHSSNIPRILLVVLHLQLAILIARIVIESLFIVLVLVGLPIVLRI